MRQLALVVASCFVAVSLFAADAGAPQRRDSVVRISPAAMQAAIDPATGQLRQLTPDEARALASNFLRSLKLRPSVPRTLADGSVMASLDDSYLNFYMGRVTAEGTVEFSCVNTPADAVSVLVAPVPSIMRRAPEQQPLEEK